MYILVSIYIPSSCFSKEQKNSICQTTAVATHTGILKIKVYYCNNPSANSSYIYNVAFIFLYYIQINYFTAGILFSFPSYVFPTSS